MKVYVQHKGDRLVSEYDVNQIYATDKVEHIKTIAQGRKVFRPAPPPPTPPRAADPPLIFHLHAAAKDKTLLNRANSKFISEALAYRLLLLNTPMRKYYQRQLRCAAELTRKGKKFTSTYCGCKTCQTCNRIRTGKLINKYDDLCQSFYDPQFVTLTVKNIERTNFDTDGQFIRALGDQIDLFAKTFRSIQDYFRKRDIPLKGIRALEVIPARNGDGAHPHIHWQIDGEIDISEFIFIWKKNNFSRDHCAFLLKQYRKGAIGTGALKGELIVNLWLKKMPLTDRQGQNSRPCDANTRKELFKYQTKIFTYNKDGARQVNIKLVDLIVQSTKGRRTIAVTGFLTRAPRFDFDLHFNNRSFVHSEKVKEMTALITAWDKEKNIFSADCPYRLPAPLDREKMRIEYESKFADQVRDYELYRSLVKVLECDINDDLDSQEMEVSENFAVDKETGELIEIEPEEIETFIWRRDNWYSDNVWRGLDNIQMEPRQAIRFKVSNKTRKLIASFNSS